MIILSLFFIQPFDVPNLFAPGHFVCFFWLDTYPIVKVPGVNTLWNTFKITQITSRAGHSTENFATFLVKVVNDFLIVVYSGLAVVLITLDLSSAFDTVNHSIL